MSTPETSAAPLPVIQQALDEIVREMGFTKLKPKQLEAIVAVVSGNDTFVSLPTGYGKSVIYGVLPPLFDKLRGIPMLVLALNSVMNLQLLQGVKEILMSA